MVAIGILAACTPDAQHPRTQSQRITERGTLSDGGVPRSLGMQQERLPDRATLLGEGASLYEVHCISCHGTNLQGSAIAPSLQAAGGASIDFYLTTGRMPLAVKAQVGHAASPFTARQISALDLFVDTHARTHIAIPAIHLTMQGLVRGREIFESNCQACHGVAGKGATVGYQWAAPSLQQASPVQIAEAVRIGPGIMPRFTQEQISDHDLSFVASYIVSLNTQPQNYGGFSLGTIGPVAEGAVGAILGVGLLLFVVYLTGTKAEKRRL